MANPENDVVHLTITEGYAPSWKTWEGVREFIQNWYDGVLDSYEIVSPPSFGRRALRIEPVRLYLIMKIAPKLMLHRNSVQLLYN